jgi:hypothetical protein
MSRARQQRNKARAAARVQLATAVAATGRPPLAADTDTPVHDALAAVMPIAPYDPADGEFDEWPWPGWSAPVAPAKPQPVRPAWATDTAQRYRLDTVLDGLGVGVLRRAASVRALTTVSQLLAAVPAPRPAAPPAPVFTAPPAPVFTAPAPPPVRELQVARPTWSVGRAHTLAGRSAA